jgi:E3 ubiquitin-protein ligase MARCH6
MNPFEFDDNMMNEDIALEASNSNNDDEHECRVCRAPGEFDHPLIHACKCSGSIGWVHQDCLQSWLAVMARRGANGKQCELCKTNFVFQPVYSDDAPEHLGLAVVAFGVARRAYRSWLPATLKIITCL